MFVAVAMQSRKKCREMQAIFDEFALLLLSKCS